MKIFVSYRREDTQDVVERLCARLAQAFGERNVFYDMRSVGTGGDFLGTVGGAIYTSDVILVVIGQGWMSSRDARGQLRLFDPDDPVGWEVGLSLASGRSLIPLLVNGANMPVKEELPERLQNLTTRSGLRLRTGAEFETSIDDLIQRLGGPVAQPAPLGDRAPRATASWVTFEGYWQTPDGGMTEITQNGDWVELNGRDVSGMVAYQARGRIEGGQAILDFVNSMGLTGRVVLRLAQPGDYINGRMLDVAGGYIKGELQTMMGAVPFDMMRRT